MVLAGLALLLSGCRVIGDDAYDWRLEQGDGGGIQDGGGTDGGGTDGGGTDGGGTDGGGTDGGGTDGGGTDGGGGCDELPWYIDADGDGFGAPGDPVWDCEQPEGYVDNADDCDDTRPAVNPDAVETCLTDYDDDCDGQTNARDVEGCDDVFPDADGDGYGDGTPQCWCEPPAGFADRAGDCAPDDPEINPGAEEICFDGVDNDCDGVGCQLEGTWSPDDADGSYAGSTSSTAGDLVAMLGDLDGDGFDELGIGAYTRRDGGSAVGGVFIVNGDGAGSLDLATDADASFLGDTTNSNFGRAFSVLDDLNGDGYPELAIGAPSATGLANTSGMVYVFYGPFSGELGVADADIQRSGGSTNLYAGRSLAGLSDATGDGVADLVVGAVGDRSAGNSAGAAWLIAGPLTGSEALESSAYAVLTGEAASDGAGRMVASAGDVDGDGLEDFLVNAWYNDVGGSNAGAAYLVLGGTSGTLSLADAEARLYGADAGDRFGIALASAGDVDGDGLPDLIVGADGQDGSGADAGAAYIFLMPLSGSVDASTASVVLRGEAEGDQAGYSVAGAGDLDGDGRAEVLIGAPGSEAGGSGGGGAWLVYGGAASGSLGSDGLVIRGTEGALGRSVAGGGDANGDGTPDLLIGASSATSGAGAAFLFYGGGL